MTKEKLAKQYAEVTGYKFHAEPGDDLIAAFLSGYKAGMRRASEIAQDIRVDWADNDRVSNAYSIGAKIEHGILAESEK